MCANARKTDGDSNNRNLFCMASEKLLPFHFKIVLLVCSYVVLESALRTINYQNKEKCVFVGKDFIGRSS